VRIALDRPGVERPRHGSAGERPATAGPAGVTALCVPLALLFLFNLYWVYPSKNGYPACDPDFQPSIGIVLLGSTLSG
jgi:hypothetical protein